MMKKNYKLILASASPRRKKILEEMGLEFDIIPSDYDEVLENNEFSYEKIELLAYNKAKEVAEKINCVRKPLTPNPSPARGEGSIQTSSSLVLGADTVVVLENEILGKPQDENDAFLMLKRLSGKKHSVVTSICAISSDGNEKICSTTSYVEFKNLSDETIKNYIKYFNPLDKAGAYGIQELPDGFLADVEGSFENIIGLCPKAVIQILENF